MQFSYAARAAIIAARRQQIRPKPPGAMLESPPARGAVAQLGERRVRNAKVEGSIPFRSTTETPMRAAFLKPIEFKPQREYRLTFAPSSEPVEPMQ